MKSSVSKIGSWWRALCLGLVAFLAACGGGGDGERPQAILLQPGTVTVQPGGGAVASITQGFPPYRIASSDPAMVQASLRGRNEMLLSVSPEAPARTYQVSVSDTRGTTVNLSVIVQVSALRVLAPTPLYLSPSSESTSVTILGGVPPYRVAVDRPGVVQASIVNNRQLVLQAQSNLGAAKVTVSDEQGVRAELEVKVESAIPLKLQPTELTVPLGGPRVNLQILGGVAPYMAQSAQPGAVRVTVVGETVQIEGLAQTTEDAIVTVIDRLGQTAVATVKVAPAVREFAMTPQSVTVSEASSQSIPFRFLGLNSTQAPTVFSSNVRLLAPEGTPTTSGVTFQVQGTGACVEKDEEVIVTAILDSGAIATAKVTVKNIANQYDDEDKLISRCPPGSL